MKTSSNSYKFRLTASESEKLTQNPDSYAENATIRSLAREICSLREENKILLHELHRTQEQLESGLNKTHDRLLPRHVSKLNTWPFSDLQIAPSAAHGPGSLVWNFKNIKFQASSLPELSCITYMENNLLHLSVPTKSANGNQWITTHGQTINDTLILPANIYASDKLVPATILQLKATPWESLVSLVSTLQTVTEDHDFYNKAGGSDRKKQLDGLKTLSENLIKLPQILRYDSAKLKSTKDGLK